MLCFSGFELHFRWVPLENETALVHPCKNGTVIVFSSGGFISFFFRWKDGLLRFLYWNSIFLNASYNFKPFPNSFTRCIAFLTQSNRLRTNGKLSLGVTTNVWCEYSVASGRPTIITFFFSYYLNLSLPFLLSCRFIFILILWSSLFLCYHRILLSSLPRFSVLYSVFPLS